MKLSLHPGASRDLEAIVEHYRREGGAFLAERFLGEIERVIRLLSANPSLGAPFDLPRRSHALRRFPYAVVYRPTDDGIRILIVRHHRRHPDYGRTRA